MLFFEVHFWNKTSVGFSWGNALTLWCLKRPRSLCIWFAFLGRSSNLMYLMNMSWCTWCMCDVSPVGILIHLGMRACQTEVQTVVNVLKTVVWLPSPSTQNWTKKSRWSSSMIRILLTCCCSFQLDSSSDGRTGVQQAQGAGAWTACCRQNPVHLRRPALDKLQCLDSKEMLFVYLLLFICCLVNTSESCWVKILLH